MGLSMALGLARAGIRNVIVERKTELDPHSRATLILPRTLEIASQWNILERLLTKEDRVPHVRLREPRNGPPDPAHRLHQARRPDRCHVRPGHPAGSRRADPARRDRVERAGGRPLRHRRRR
ncbi:MAG: FAD-dependent oxidoreductase, partial [Candidatus Dormibacteria bacterium]